VLRRALMAAAASDQIRGLLTGTPAARAMVARYVAGDNASDAVRVARELRAAGLLVTLDYLGEDTKDALRAAAVRTEYIALLEKLQADGLTAGGAVEVSVKLTAVGLLLPSPEGVTPRARQPGDSAAGERLAFENIERIAAAADAAGTTVTIDAEDHRTTDASLRIAGRLRERYPSVGSVVQASLRRTETDVRALATAGSDDAPRVRLCKGAYNEPVSEAFTDPHEIDKSFARCLRVLMEGPGYPMVATHDPRLVRIAAALGLARPFGSFEYQMLYGIRADEQARLAASGASVRVYVPYGGDWYGYLVRRLAERPASLGLLLRSLYSPGGKHQPPGPPGRAPFGRVTPPSRRLVVPPAPRSVRGNAGRPTKPPTR
jgi:proline dehydrogenase